VTVVVAPLFCHSCRWSDTPYPERVRADQEQELREQKVKETASLNIQTGVRLFARVFFIKFRVYIFENNTRVEFVCCVGCLDFRPQALDSVLTNGGSRGPVRGRGARLPSRPKAQPSLRFADVYVDKTGRWVAQVSAQGKQHFVGSYGTEEDAGQAAQQAAAAVQRGDGVVQLSGGYGDGTVAHQVKLLADDPLRQMNVANAKAAGQPTLDPQQVLQAAAQHLGGHFQQRQQQQPQPQPQPQHYQAQLVAAGFSGGNYTSSGGSGSAAPLISGAPFAGFLNPAQQQHAAQLAQQQLAQQQLAQQQHTAQLQYAAQQRAAHQQAVQQQHAAHQQQAQQQNTAFAAPLLHTAFGAFPAPHAAAGAFPPFQVDVKLSELPTAASTAAPDASKAAGEAAGAGLAAELPAIAAKDVAAPAAPATVPAPEVASAAPEVASAAPEAVAAHSEDVASAAAAPLAERDVL
jgi:hypothetical protein